MQFTQQITTLLVAGITLPDAVKTFRKGQPRSAAQQLLTALESDLGRGLSLSQALSAFPTSFDPLYLRLIAAGESLERSNKRLVSCQPYYNVNTSCNKKSAAP